jgi:hypothetical protein
MATPFSYKITVTEISESPAQDSAKLDRHPEYLTREVFAMAVDAADFDLPTFVQAINKRKRVRKARGKETQ